MTTHPKICSRCKQEKHLELFSKDKRSKSGFAARCKACVVEVGMAWQAKNREKCVENSLRWQATNKKQVETYRKEYFAKNRGSLLLGSRRYWNDNRDTLLKKQRNRVSPNRDKYNKLQAEWRKKNPHIVAEMAARRRTLVKQVTPKWANRSKINAIYEKAHKMSIETGIDYHVDHVIPLNSHFVCGLHCEHNLQIIPAKENIFKSNHFDFKGEI